MEKKALGREGEGDHEELELRKNEDFFLSIR